jgi:tripartite-type tricarboxylate transporter receptor subunit TctC
LKIAPAAAEILARRRSQKHRPNGYTVGLIQLGNVAINPHVYADMTFDPLNDLVPVAPVTSSAILVVANANVATNDLRELIAPMTGRYEMLAEQDADGSTRHAHLLREGRVGT